MPPENEELETGLGPGEEGLEGTEGESEAPSYFIGELPEDEVLGRLNRVNEFPETISALESRFTGSLGSVAQRLEQLEKSQPTQSSLDIEKITKGLEAYDPKLAEVLGPLLQDAFQTRPLDETTLRPHLDPIKTQMQEWVGEQLVRQSYSPQDLEEIIPPTEDGRFMPQGQRHKDFIDWYAKQGYETQQSLLSFGVPYIRALKSFEKYEAKLNQDRAAAAQNKQQQLANGRVPTSGGKTPPPVKKLSDEEAWLEGVNQGLREVGRL